MKSLNILWHGKKMVIMYLIFQLVYEHRFVERNITCQLLEFKRMCLIVRCDTPLIHAYDSSHADDNMIKQVVCHTRPCHLH